MPRDSLIMRFGVWAIAAIAVLHMLAVTIAGLPTNTMSQTLAPVTSYLSPYFTQNWRLFAPQPISADRTLWVQGEYRDADGERHRTAWFDWTEVELDLIEGQLVGGRAGYVTNKLLGPLGNAYGRLSSGQRELAANDRAAATTSYREFRENLLKESPRPQSVDRYVRYEQTTVRLATAVLAAVHPDIDLSAVRYRIGRQPVLPYEKRALPAAAREDQRLDVTYRNSGWRLPLPAQPREQHVFDDFLSRHR